MIRLIVLSLFVSALTPVTPWYAKPAYQKRIREQRDVIVSIKNEEASGKSYYRMTGAGVLRATPAFTLKKILAFEELPKISDYFKKVVHQPELNRVYLVLEAFNYEARLLIKYSIKDQPDKSVFHWSVVWGGFEGMIGDIELSRLGPDKTEAILISTFDDKQVPLPAIFKGIVLETIVHYVAKSMRTHIEDEYKKSKAE